MTFKLTFKVCHSKQDYWLNLKKVLVSDILDLARLN